MTVTKGYFRQQERTVGRGVFILQEGIGRGDWRGVGREDWEEDGREDWDRGWGSGLGLVERSKYWPCT